MNATAKFYTGFCVALAIIVAVSFAIGYKSGASHVSRFGAPPLTGYDACLRELKRSKTGQKATASQKAFDLLLGSSDCAKVHDVSFYSARDIYDVTGVLLKPDMQLNDPAWQHPDNPRRQLGSAFGPSGLR